MLRDGILVEGRNSDIVTGRGLISIPEVGDVVSREDIVLLLDTFNLSNELDDSLQVISTVLVVSHIVDNLLTSIRPSILSSDLPLQDVGTLRLAVDDILNRTDIHPRIHHLTRLLRIRDLSAHVSVVERIIEAMELLSRHTDLVVDLHVHVLDRGQQGISGAASETELILEVVFGVEVSLFTVGDEDLQVSIGNNVITVLEGDADDRSTTDSGDTRGGEHLRSEDTILEGDKVSLVGEGRIDFSTDAVVLDNLESEGQTESLKFGDGQFLVLVIRGSLQRVGSDDRLEIEGAVELHGDVAGLLGLFEGHLTHGPSLEILDVSLVVFLGDTEIPVEIVVLEGATEMGILSLTGSGEVILGPAVLESDHEVIELILLEHRIVGGNELTVSLLDIESHHGEILIIRRSANHIDLNGQDTVLEALEDRGDSEVLGSLGLGLDLIRVRNNDEGEEVGGTFLQEGEVSVGRVHVILG